MAASDIVTEAQVDALAAAIVADVNSVRAKIGTLASLSTTDKANLVAAINEIYTLAMSGSVPDASETVKGKIELATEAEGLTGTDTTRAVTPAVLAAVRAALKAEILGGATSAFDTLNELKALLDASDSADDAALAALVTADGNRLRVDTAAQGLDSTQKSNALTNLGVARSVQDFAGDYTGAIA